MLVADKSGISIRELLSESAVGFFGRFAAYENINRDEQAAYEEEAEKARSRGGTKSKRPVAGRFRGLPESTGYE